MKKSELARVLMPIQEVFDTFRLTEPLLALWMRLCGHHTIEEFEAAVIEYLGYAEFPPKPGSINKIILRSNKINMTAIEGFQLVQNAVSRFGLNRIGDALESLPTICVRAIGGEPGFKAFCLSDVDDLSTFRAQFTRAFMQAEEQQSVFEKRNALGLPCERPTVGQSRAIELVREYTPEGKQGILGGPTKMISNTSKEKK